MKEAFHHVIRLLEDGNKNAAKDFFNEKIQFLKKEVENNTASLDEKMLLLQIDDYLNDPAVEITGAVNLIDLKRSYLELFGSDGNNS